MKKIILIVPMLILAFQGTIIGQNLEEKVRSGVKQSRKPSSVRTTDPDGTTREMVFSGPNGAPMYGLPAPEVREEVQEQQPQRKPSSVRTTDSDGTEREMVFRGSNGAPMQGLPAPDRGTPLMAAASLGDLEEIGQLLDNGAEIDATDKSGRTALMFAAINGQTAAVDLLAKRGADVNAKDHNGDTPLMAAALYGHQETCDTLIDHGAALY